ncbi:MAG: extracellular solute-binding protein [Roseburia sp.]|nr:extracellular solute-binding protein [Roseburia sp.]
MKKRFKTRALSVGLALAMTLSLAGCSRGGEGNGPGGSGSGSKGNASASSELAKQNVYSYQELDFDMGQDFDIWGATLVGDRLYMVMSYYDESTYESKLALSSMNKDGSDIKKALLQPQGSDESADGYEENPGEETEGEEEPVEEDLEENEPLEEDDNEEDSWEEDDEEFWDDDEDSWDDEEPIDHDRYEYSNYNQTIITEDGVVYGIRNHYLEDYSDPENYIYEQTYFLDCWDLEGNAQWEKPLDMLQTNDDEDSYWVTNLIDLKEDGLAIVVNGQKMGKIIVDKEGNLSGIQPFAGDDSLFENYQNMIASKDGTLIVSYYTNDDWDKQYLSELNIRTGETSAPVELPATISYNGFYNVYPGANTDFVYGANDGIYTYNMGDDAAVKIMDYVNSDINVGNLTRITMIDDTHFVGVYYDAIEWNSCAAIFTKVNPEDIKDKQILVLGGSYVSSDSQLMKRVIDFNKSSDTHRIVVKDYSSYNSSEDYMAGYTQLNNDIISGNMPDILQVSSGMPIESYVSKGLLANIDELIAGDEELSKVEFMQNVFDAYRVDGKLYQVLPSFRVQSFIAKSSLVGDRKGWTMQELKEIQPTLPEGISIFGETTRDSFLNTIMEYCGRDFVDVNTGKCSFDSQTFIDLLELANTFPEEIDYSDDRYGDDWWMNYQSQYRDNRTLLNEMYISSLMWVKEDINGSMGEDVSYVGFPTEDGQGSILAATDSYAISAKSANVDGAWNFIRHYLTEEYQKSDEFWGLSVHKKILEDSKKLAMEKSYWTDENGEKIEYDDTIYINGEEIAYDPLSQEQADELFDFICSVSKREYYNEDVMKIVTEEAAAYFSGQKSATDVAGLIQNRAQLYINENL